MFKVIRNFKDNDGVIYKAGDTYPSQKGKKPSNARIKTLSTTNNKYEQVYIEKIIDEKG